MLDLLNLSKSVISLLIVVDPLGNIPIFLGITGSLVPEERRRAFDIAVITGLSLLTGIAVLGEWVLRIFDIELYSFRIAGGVLLLFIALELLMKASYEARSYNPEQAGAVPLGVPLLVGPGAITTVIIILKAFGIAVAIFSVAIAAIVTWLILRFASPIYRALGEVGATVVSKVMAMLLAAIAVQYILEGVREYLMKLRLI